MFENYFKLAWRNLIHNKLYSLLNILGLATGMAVALIIGLWIWYQYSYDRFLPDSQQIYKAGLKGTGSNGEIYAYLVSPMPLAEALRKDVPGIKHAVMTDWIKPHGLVAGERKIYLPGIIAENDFLKIFQYPLLKGRKEQVLNDPYSIVLTESTARSLFGNEDPLNKIVRIDNQNDLKVTGVLKDIPDNSTLKFNYVIPYEYLIQNSNTKDYLNMWGQITSNVYVSLQPGVSYAQVEPVLKKIIARYNPEEYKRSHSEIIMQEMKDWHLYTEFKNGVATGGLIGYVRVFSITGILVLLIACINFMNLSTARSEKRAKEVGVRKVVGSRRYELILQFLTESLVITFAAFILSLLLVQIALPSFNILTQTTIRIPYTNVFFWMIMISYLLLTGLLAGGRPAFYLSSFRPVRVLRADHRAVRSRKMLVLIQFTCSITLIISTIIIYQQIKYAQERPVGYDQQRLVMTDASSDLKKNYTALKNDLMQSGMVTAVTISSETVTALRNFSGIESWPGKIPEEEVGAAVVFVADNSYFRTMGIELAAGRDFTGNASADSLNVILNEAAIKQMHLKDPIGQVIAYNGCHNLKIIGIAKNAIMESPFSSPTPTVFMYRPGGVRFITYRLSPKVSTTKAIDRIAQIFGQYNTAYPYIYNFVDEAYAKKFELEMLIGKLTGLFSLLAIFISCLGLFGLASYMAEQRTKEIGIRKILGASVMQLWALLSREFVLLVMISCLIASPLAFYFLNNWLEKYVYRISIGPLVFILTAILTVGITVLTVSFQAVKAAMVNPVRSLKTE
ncbi:ABC transporter permease [Chitinophaga tropicalis]|uniref:FtsX-like permease family protein n=1 Tax=Chitinophaga tropicalis TaxID=2683588 RepID=A0A7K1TX73_9BACT|nr:ABC transporter permease [Chitinophaga tropicalis]MVT06711.1 FtsX-like permease family protein [Chitinophaga tropicalis]